MKKTILFDLDGTLTDSSEGITKTIQFTLESLGQPVPAASELKWCLGPPLLTSFQHMLAGCDPELPQRALELYRSRYRAIGMFENAVYPDIPRVLEALTTGGFKLFIATSKPWSVAEQIADHFGISRYFLKVHGCEFDGRRSEKGDLIQYILNEHRLSPDKVLMVGDRKHDVIGARKNDVATVGVTYGYGDREGSRTN
jgi:phosphoglycolate phosphatase